MNIAIIGSNRGIGLALTKNYCQDSNNNVFAFCRKASDELNSCSAKVIEGCEVTNFDDLKAIATNFINTQFDLFIHVSGILNDESFGTIEPKSIEKQFLVNSISPLMCVESFSKSLGKGSKVALITSRMGSIADNSSGGRYGYRMSKAAVNAAGKSLSIDLKDKGVSVFLVHPGYVQTDMTGGNGNLTTEESATGIAKVLDSHGINESGSFYHCNGEELPW